VENVSWHEATNYCARLTVQERLAGRLPFNYAYRLPTEAEWEYAARARTTNRFHYGPDLRSGWANFDCRLRLTDPCPVNPVLAVVAPSLSPDPQPIAVGQFAANAWGLQDVHGNVAEWCLDWLGDTLPGMPMIDPRGPAAAPVRAVRGGAFLDSDLGCESSARVPLAPGGGRNSVGFRVALSSSPPAVEFFVVAVQPGFNFIANQLDKGGNTLQEIMPFMPLESRFFKWNPVTQAYLTGAISDGADWLDVDTLAPSTLTLSPGEGGFLELMSSTSMNLFFSGLRRTTIVTPVLVSGQQHLSRQVPEPGNYASIVRQPPVEGVKVFRFIATNNNYSTSTFSNGTWHPAPPTARRGEPWIVELP
jgi:hypothetical protein